MVLAVFEIMMITLGSICFVYLTSCVCCSGDIEEEYNIERTPCFPNFFKKNRESFNKHAEQMVKEETN
jgi:reverse gyrase